MTNINEVTKHSFGYRNAKGHQKWLDLASHAGEWPEDMPAAYRVAAQASKAALFPVAAEVGEEVQTAQAAPETVAEGIVKRGRGRPKGFKCSPETRAQMAESKRRMWQELKANAADANPERYADVG